MSHDITTAIGAAAFWVFVAVVVVAGVSSSVFRHRETQKTIRQAIDKGQTLDPETLERLMQGMRPPPPSRIGLMLGGLVMICIGIGFAVMGWFASIQKPENFYQFLGIGCLIAMIGVPLLAVSFFVRDRNGAGRG